MSALHRQWLAGEARRTLVAPELRHVDEPAISRKVTTGTGIVIGYSVSRVSRAPYAGQGPYRNSALRRALRWLAIYPDRVVGAMCAIGALAVAIDVVLTAPPLQDAQAAALIAAANRK